jgi:DNA-directed RNA polymerase subunit RPC12/RpoP
MKPKAVEVKCRKCGKLADANSFVLDHTYRMMVCPACVREIKTKQMVQSELKAQREEKLAEKNLHHKEEAAPQQINKEEQRQEKELEKAYNDKLANTVQAQPVGDDRVKYKCQNCSYEFIYNLVKEAPSKCPYCGTAVSRIKV